MMLWSLALLRERPSERFVRSLWHFSGARLGAFNAQDCGNVLWALGALKMQPPDEWLDALQVGARGIAKF